MKQSFTLLLLFIIAFSAQAQEEGHVSLILNGAGSIPQKNFREISTKDFAGVGGRLQVLYNPISTPIHFGPEIGYQIMDYNEETFHRQLNGLTDTLRISATGKMATVLMNVRVQAPKINSPINPFADLLFGTNVIYTTEKRVTSDYWGKRTKRNSITSNWATCYGGSVGFDIRMDADKPNKIIEFRTSYLVGDKANYLTDANIKNDGTITYKNNSSYTTMIVAQLGMKWRF